MSDPPPPPPPPSPTASASQLPPDVDVLAVGRSIFGGEAGGPAPPLVEGYSHLEFLAEGGFGRVWRGIRDADQCPVALKIPHRTDPEASERLEAEARALQSLAHPHIVRLLGVTAAENGAPVLVMDLIDGRPLTTYLPEHGFDFGDAIRLFLPVLEAIAHAHDRGILHRDLKPSNILLAGGTTPKVSDFGLAQSIMDQRLAFSLTRSGFLAGTVEYLAPERYDPGSEASTADDIYALGVILYEMLTGRPPRGAWEPLSQVKRLDVRLDELLTDAIHPDPAKRLKSAALFRQRLEGIRDSQPRYAGTPLATRPVRTADLLWTLAGLYSLAAGYCSLLSINNTDVPALFDLRLGHTFLLGGFWALWILTITMGLVWGWQGFRLWRFRHVPLREALPSPLGLRLGSSRGAARLVALAQVLCAWAPLVYIGWIYSQVWFWASPETASWENVLAVTRWGSTDPVSPWTWDPAGLVSGDEYWIREMRPGYVNETWQLLDRQSFLVFTQPLAMLLGAIGIAAGILATVVTTFRRWRSSHRRALCLFLLATAAWGASMVSAMREGVAAWKFSYSPTNQVWRANESAERQLKPALEAVYDSLLRNPNINTDIQSVANAFAPRVKVADGMTLDREDLVERLEKDRLAHQSVEHFRERQLIGDGIHRRTTLEFERYTDPPGQPSSGAFTTLTCECFLTEAETPQAFITTWAEETLPLYTTSTRELTQADANTWIERLITTLQTKHATGLEDFFLPIILATEPEDRPEDSPIFRRTLTSSLRASFTAHPEIRLTLEEPPAIESLPGARWHLTCQIRQTGGRRPRTLNWQLDLVPQSDGNWKALRLRM